MNDKNNITENLQENQELQNNNIESKETDLNQTQQETKDELSELKEQLEKQKDAYLRLLAEFDNFRKRTEKEKFEIADVIKGSVVRDFLPILDSLEKAYEACVNDESIRSGIELVIKAFKQLLEKYEIKEVDTECEFNPNLHEALMIVESNTPNKIVQVFEKGYTYKDKLLRPAKVSVGKLNNNDNNTNEDKNEEV
ncbi:MAG: nucleotide exchange factor GrpE [Desulfurella sp.]|jgi:molecular chaperone GrpE|uniref:nucleotide exchange factor GrpE n=1 Tax=Desulfurella sp. TaxID=1962857 RepID=UPI0003E092D5|nr:nucleotide exchange factor GrpE [Desulfurella sp.]AHF96630.1 heat shock protein GrpE [Desulfurella acetivorans A63]PMP87332.1 MAG: nucleotide exchange factor GrpE [Desulfurella sp.]HEX13157.1 nucleotide exchange factor GrpE [Desulfurella acetivorans]